MDDAAKRSNSSTGSWRQAPLRQRATTLCAEPGPIPNFLPHMLIWLAGDGAAAERPLRGMQQGENWHIVLHTQKLSPFTGDSSRARPVGDAARGESGGIGSIASGSEARRPYSNQRCGCECNEQTEGLYRGCSCLRQPLSQSASRRIASSPAGEPFGWHYMPRYTS